MEAKRSPKAWLQTDDKCPLLYYSHMHMCSSYTFQGDGYVSSSYFKICLCFSPGGRLLIIHGPTQMLHLLGSLSKLLTKPQRNPLILTYASCVHTEFLSSLYHSTYHHNFRWINIQIDPQMIEREVKRQGDILSQQVISKIKGNSLFFLFF